MSSAKPMTLTLCEKASFSLDMYILKSSGENTDPWGQPGDSLILCLCRYEGQKNSPDMISQGRIHKNGWVTIHAFRCTNLIYHK